MIERISFRWKLCGAIVITTALSLALALSLLSSLFGTSFEQAGASLSLLKPALVIALVTLGVAYFLARSFEHLLLGPIDQLVDAIDDVRANRNYDTIVSYKAKDQFRQLVDSFNALMLDLRASEAQIEQAMRSLEDARDQSEQSSIAKSQFLANMSHELRTPLNAILGYSELLIEDMDDDGQQDAVDDLHKIRRSAHHLLTLINDILDLSKIEAGRMDVEKHKFDIAELVDDVIGTITPLASQRQNKISVNIEPGVGSMVSDSVKVRQVLLNLLSNACKFTESGIISVSVRQLAQAGHGTVQITVSDTGIGMSEEHLSRIFQAFTQADASTTRKFGGTGLGLAITKKFVELMDGDISVSSEPGVGTSFSVLLPRQFSDSPSTETSLSDAHIVTDHDSLVSSAVMGGFLVLVIDDEPMAQELNKRWIERLGHRVIIAPNGRQGLELARKLKPNVILLDISMPGLNGWEVLQQLKEDPATAHIPAIMVSAHDDRKRAVLLGAVELLTKPVARDDLNQLLTLYSGRSEGHILLVEDDVAMADIYKRSITSAGFQVHHAKNGIEALKLIDKRKDFRMAVVDLMMPEMDGFQFLEALETQYPDMPMPVMVLTAKDLTLDDRKRLAGHAQMLRKKGNLSPRELLGDIYLLTGETTEVALAKVVNG
jgi:signal transduction histidine kinase/DNA-binding response OmpR family regulator